MGFNDIKLWVYLTLSLPGSHYCLSHNSYDVSSENLVLYQLKTYFLIVLFILFTCLFDIVLIL